MFKTIVVTGDANTAMTELVEMLDNKIKKFESLKHKKESARSAPALTTIPSNEKGGKSMICLAVTVEFSGVS